MDRQLKILLDSSVQTLYSLIKEKNIMNSNLTYIIEAKYPNPNRVLERSEDHVYSHLGYEEKYKNMPFSILYIYKNLYVNKKYIVDTTMPDTLTKMRESGLYIDSKHCDKMIYTCGLVFAIDKLLINKLCNDIAEIIVNEMEINDNTYVSSVKFLAELLEFLVTNYNGLAFMDNLNRYINGVTRHEVKLVSKMFKMIGSLLNMYLNIDMDIIGMFKGKLPVINNIDDNKPIIETDENK